MPWSGKQHRLFEALAHGEKPRSPNVHISQADAARMASEGVKESEKKKGQRKALRAMGSK